MLQELVVLYYYAGHLNTRHHYYGTLTLLFLKIEPRILNIPHSIIFAEHLNETHFRVICFHLRNCLLLINSNTTSNVLIGNNFGNGYSWAQTTKKKKKKPSTNSATKNKARLLIIQGTDFNYTENITFKNTSKCKGREKLRIKNTSIMLQQCPLLARTELCRLKKTSQEDETSKKFCCLLLLFDANNEIKICHFKLK